MKQITFLFLVILIMTFSSLDLSAQTASSIPGSDIVTPLFPELSLDSDEGMKLCCFAAYGWQIVEELKSEVESSPLPFEGESIAERLLIAGLLPVQHKQFFRLNDGRIVVVINDDMFKRSLNRFVTNAHNANLIKK
ncbi:MAG: hypothetical protein ACKVJ6_02365 [Flavobacteriales bacterium]